MTTLRMDNETEWMYEFHAIDGALLDTADNETTRDRQTSSFFSVYGFLPPTCLKLCDVSKSTIAKEKIDKKLRAGR